MLKKYSLIVLFQLIYLSWISLKELMLKNGSKEINPNDPDFLNLAVQQNNKELVRCLLEKGCNINAQDEMQRSPIHWATLFGNKDMVEFLLQNGADVNQRTKNGFTLLHHSIMEGKECMCEMLLEFGADLYALDYWNYSPLERAIQEGNPQIVKLLLKFGICLDARNVDDGNNALEYCLKKKEKKRFDNFKMMTFHGLNKL